MESKYWAFIKAHPAHVSLPARAKVEAMEVLRWAWAGMYPLYHDGLNADLCVDGLLPSQRTTAVLFTEQECRSLMSILRSFHKGETIC